ncbi:MAG: VanZ family protein [Anaerolineae bacterium]
MEVVFGSSTLRLWVAAVIILGAGLALAWRRTHNFAYVLCCLVFGIYVLFALNEALFPIRIDTSYVAAPEQFLWSMNVIPFRFNFSELANIVVLQIFQNILLTMPFGFGISFIVPIKQRQVFMIAPVIGLGIEAVQLSISLLLRYPYRIIDINDALLNALGVVVGYGLFRAFAWLLLKSVKHIGTKPSGLPGYIYEVAARR